MAGRGRGKKAAVAPKKKAGGYSMPPPIPNGEIIKNNIFKKEWRIGPSIGIGGFGEIYSAADLSNSPKKKGSSYNFAIKVEPHENGPLFVEKNFYCKNAVQADITKFMKSKNLSSLGMPTFHGMGTHEYNGGTYRYLVLEKYGKDIWSIFLESGKQFPPATVFILGLQMLDVLEYIHSRGYAHADIKGPNMLLGLKKGTENQAYLVDFGLAKRIKDQAFAPDKRCAHDGTVEYTSRDAHLGEATLRGDLEILGYNMLQWIVGELPWDRDLKRPAAVQAMKESFINDVRKNITDKYSSVPDALIKYFEYINSMGPKELPDYEKCRKLFEGYLKKEGKTRNSKLVFTALKDANKVTETVQNSDDTDQDEVKALNSDAPKKRGRKPKNHDADTENKVPEEQKRKKKIKRKSIEPSLVTKVKKTKLNPKSTPPAKKNHANIATQTSVERRRSLRKQIESVMDISRHVSFDSPVSTTCDEKPKPDSTNTSADLFEDSIVEDKKKPKRKLIVEEEVEMVVKKQRVTKKREPNKKSWKEAPTIRNGRNPPK